jgi:quercetin dioxygenase-like cupin family protein
MHFLNFNEIDFTEKHKGMFGKVLTGEKMQLAYVKLEYGIETSHNHPHEQIGYILKGEVEIIIGEEKKRCGAGQAYYIPSNMQHGFKVIAEQGVEYIEVFSPPKVENKIT